MKYLLILYIHIRTEKNTRQSIQKVRVEKKKEKNER